jgi:hypothetical protein
VNDWVGLVQAAGPILIGLGGLIVAYRAGIRPGREARHHARAELLYLDMLDALSADRDEISAWLTRLNPVDNRSDAPDDPQEANPDSSHADQLAARVELFAALNVAITFQQACWPLDQLRGHLSGKSTSQVDSDEWHRELNFGAELIGKYEAARSELLLAMKQDLEIPRHASRYIFRRALRGVVFAVGRFFHSRREAWRRFRHYVP